MTLRLLVKPEARRDIEGACTYYEATGNGEAFRDRVEVVLHRLVELPTSSPIVYRDVRRALVRDFPYSVFYLVEDARVVVLAVLHQVRDPSSWPRP